MDFGGEGREGGAFWGMLAAAGRMGNGREAYAGERSGSDGLSGKALSMVLRNKRDVMEQLRSGAICVFGESGRDDGALLRISDGKGRGASTA